MAWIDAETGRPYTEKELAGLRKEVDQGAKTAPESAPMANSAVQASPEPPNGPVSIDQSTLENFGSGAMASLKKTYLGLKQLATYVSGNPEARQAVNDEIARMEEEYGPALNTTAGKVGEVVGTVGQFVVPGMAAAKIGKAIPATAAIASKLFGAPGSIGRAAVTAGAFEGAQPVEPGNTRTEDFLLQKGGRAAVGAATGAASAALVNKILNPGIPIPKDRQLLVSQAKQQGYELTPAQRTNNRGFWSDEKRFGIQPSTVEGMDVIRAAQQAIPDETAMRTLGLQGAPLNADSLEFAKRKASRLYDAVKRIGPFPQDQSAIQDIQTIITDNPEVKTKGEHLLNLLPKMDGPRFASQLQKLRNDIRDAYKAGGAGTNTADALKDLSSRFEQYGEDAVQQLASKGAAPADALQQMRDGRSLWATIHRIEPSIDYSKNRLDVRKFLRSEEKYHPVVKTPTDKALKELRDVSETWRGIQPPDNLARTSGTPEGLNALARGTLLGKAVKATRIGDVINDHLEGRAFENYLSKAGKPSVLGGALPASVNLRLRRLFPQLAIGAGEAMD
jgi:hypothetical protein